MSHYYKIKCFAGCILIWPPSTGVETVVENQDWHSSKLALWLNVWNSTNIIPYHVKKLWNLQLDICQIKPNIQNSNTGINSIYRLIVVSMAGISCILGEKILKYFVHVLVWYAEPDFGCAIEVTAHR